jgi:hypothetical protein
MVLQQLIPFRSVVLCVVVHGGDLSLSLSSSAACENGLPLSLSLSLSLSLLGVY